MRRFFRQGTDYLVANATCSEASVLWTVLTHGVNIFQDLPQADLGLLGLLGGVELLAVLNCRYLRHLEIIMEPLTRIPMKQGKVTKDYC